MKTFSKFYLNLLLKEVPQMRTEFFWLEDMKLPAK